MHPDAGMAWTIRMGSSRDARAAQRLAPALFTPDAAPDRILAADDPGGRTVGIAAIAWRTWGAPPGFPAWVAVHPAFRRRGCGGALVRSAAALCRDDTARFHAWHAVDSQSPAAHFAASLDATTHRTTLHYEADVAAFAAMIGPIVARLRQRRRIPAHAWTVPLDAASRDEVERIVRATFGSRFDMPLARSRNGIAGGYDAQRSRVLVHDGRVQGALLYHWNDGIPSIEVNIVSPALRGSWANALLLHDATVAGAEAGARRFRFHCGATVRDTINLARRAGATLARTSLEWTLELEAIAPAG